MFDDISQDLAAEHAEALSRLPHPAPVVRSLLTASAHDHRYAEDHRKSSQDQRARFHGPRAARLSRTAAIAETRAARLSRTAAIAETRAAELLAEVR